MPPAHQVARKVMHCMGIPRLLAPELCTALVAAGGFSDKNFRIFWSQCENPDILEASICTISFFLLRIIHKRRLLSFQNS